MFTINDDSLPGYVKKLPEFMRNKWVDLYNEVSTQDGEEIAFITANRWLNENMGMLDDIESYEGDGKVSHAFNKDLMDVNDETLVVDEPEVVEVSISDVTKAVELIINRLDKIEEKVMPTNVSSEEVLLSFIKEGELVKNADGTNYVDFILTDNGYNNDGMKVSEGLMNKWAEQINSGSLILKGDENHADFDTLMAKGVSKEKFIPLLKKFKKGFAKSVKAIVDNGKMWVRAIVSPGYEDLIDRATGVSIEARLDIDDNTNEAYDGDLGGFTFSTGSFKPINPRSKIDR